MNRDDSPLEYSDSLSGVSAHAGRGTADLGRRDLSSSAHISGKSVFLLSGVSLIGGSQRPFCSGDLRTRTLSTDPLLEHELKRLLVLSRGPT